MSNKFRNSLFVIAIGLTTSTFGFSQAPETAKTVQGKPLAKPATVEDDVEAVRASAKAFADAFNSHDAKAVAASWAKDGEYVDEVGEAFVGREAIEACYAEVLKAMPDSKIKVLVDSVRILGGNVAIEDGRTVIEPAAPGTTGLSSYTAVHTKVDGKWQLASVREKAVDVAPSTVELADLEFLIGDWSAEENGTRTESSCRWIANKRFVERRYTNTNPDGTSSTGLQIIGWNPQGGYIQSWNFSADGGHAIGLFSAAENGWVAEVTGTTGEGLTTTSINTLKKLDNDAYVWQSVERTVDGNSLPDSPEVVLRRKPATK